MNSPASGNGKAINILPHHGEALLFDNFFSKEESDSFFARLMREVSWKHETIRIFGREVLQPRLTASFADKGVEYGYSGLRLASASWTPALSEIRLHVEQATGTQFNTALLNQYRNGSDSMGWHRDNEKELGAEPVIASVSLGQIRRFQLRPFAAKSPLITVALQHGSLLVMKGECQHYWQHRVPKTSTHCGARINITFRLVRTRQDIC